MLLQYFSRTPLFIDYPIGNDSAIFNYTGEYLIGLLNYLSTRRFLIFVMNHNPSSGHRSACPTLTIDTLRHFTKNKKSRQ